MNYAEFVEQHGLHGKTMQVMQASKSSYGRIGALTIIFGGTKDKPWSTLTQNEKKKYKDEQVSELAENVYVKGGSAQVVGTWTF